MMVYYVLCFLLLFGFNFAQDKNILKGKNMETTVSPSLFDPVAESEEEYEYYEVADYENENDNNITVNDTQELSSEDMKMDVSTQNSILQDENQYDAKNFKQGNNRSLKSNMIWRLVGCLSILLMVSCMENSDTAPSDSDKFGMLSDISSIPGIQLNKEILMQLEPEVLTQLLKTLEASGLAKPTNQAFVDPPAALNQIEEVDTCPDTDANGVSYYCKDMPDGLYHDPWNPWCGYIKCTGSLVERVNCPRGTWMDIKSTLGMGQKDLCQLPLRTSNEEKACHMHSDMYMCKNAERIPQKPTKV